MSGYKMPKKGRPPKPVAAQPAPRRKVAAIEFEIEQAKETLAPIMNKRGRIDQRMGIPVNNVLITRTDGSSQMTKVQFVPWVDTVPRDEWREAMMYDDSDRSLRLLDLLNETANAEISIVTLAASVGLRVPDLFDIWVFHMKKLAKVASLEKSHYVARDMSIDALSRDVCCARCDGAGEVKVSRREGVEWIVCPTCEGSGRERRVGDVKSRQWTMESAEVIKHDAPVAVNVNMGGADSILDELERYERPAINVTPNNGA